MQRRRIRLGKTREIGEVKQQSVTWSPHLNMGYAKAAQSFPEESPRQASLSSLSGVIAAQNLTHQH